MGFRFRKSIKLAPGARLNFGEKSVSISFGTKGLRHTISTTGRMTSSIGIPGTGISFTTSNQINVGSLKTKGFQALEKPGDKI